MKKFVIIPSITVLVVISIFYFTKKSAEDSLQSTNLNPQKNGYISDEKTAVKIAETILLPIYGEEILKEEKPFHATLRFDSIWIIEGTLKPGIEGGTAYVEIQKKDCKILKITHSK